MPLGEILKALRQVGERGDRASLLCRQENRLPGLFDLLRLLIDRTQNAPAARPQVQHGRAPIALAEALRREELPRLVDGQVGGLAGGQRAVKGPTEAPGGVELHEL